jgi:hypothetical protein
MIGSSKTTSKPEPVQSHQSSELYIFARLAKLRLLMAPDGPGEVPPGTDQQQARQDRHPA